MGAGGFGARGPGLGARGALIATVAVASLVAGYVAGVRTDEGVGIEERTGVVGAISAAGDSVCIDTPPIDGSEDCRQPRLAPGAQLPQPGTRVRAGFAFLPGEDGRGLVGSWVYFVEIPG